MAKSLSPEEIDRLARRRAGAKLGWYVHATVYLLVNAALFAASSMGLGHRQWPIVPALGWGLVLHGLAVFVLGTGNGLEPQVAGGQVNISARCDDGALVLDVQDTGVGMSASTDGKGFGVAQVRERLVSAFDGEAALTLVPAARGTHFRITLPMDA